MPRIRLLPSSSLLLALSFATACSGAKGQAETVIAAADQAIAALPADAAKVTPDQVTPLSDAVAQARDLVARGDYAGASERVRDIAAQAKVVADSLPARKAALTATLDTLAVAMPRNLAAIKSKLDQIGKKLPRGLDQQQLQEAKDTYAQGTTEWDAITKAAQAGELGDAMSRALQLKTRVTHSLMALGLTADERAWSNVTLPPR